MRELVGEPSRRLEDVDFALGGHDFRGDTGRARAVGVVPFNVFPRAISAARINLNVDAARAREVRGVVHVPACSSSPPAAPRSSRTRYAGIERWFEPGRELLVVHDADEAVDAYRELLADPAPGRGARAAARASASSTSTRTPIAPAACSTCSASESRRAPVSDTVAVPAPSSAPPGLAELRRIAIVPALNEERALPGVIDELRAFDPGLDVVVVDDGSVDRTAAVAEAKGARVLRLPFNLGIGGAVQTGFRFAFEHGYDLAVRVDGDGQHDPSQLGRLVAPVLAGEADIAVGSRFAADEAGYRSSRTRRIGIRLLARVVSRIVGQRVTDTTSGLPGAQPSTASRCSRATIRTTTPRSRRR